MCSSANHRTPRPPQQEVSDALLQLEAAARRSIEVDRGVAYSDEEWNEAKRELFEFFRVAADIQLARQAQRATRFS